jgi:hypothetical protein
MMRMQEIKDQLDPKYVSRINSEETVRENAELYKGLSNRFFGKNQAKNLVQDQKKMDEKKPVKEKIYKPTICKDGHEGKRRGRKLGTIAEDPSELKKTEEMASEIQSVLFDSKDPEKEWTTVKARRFLTRHSLRPMKRAHVTKSGKIHFRIEDPNNYARMRTIKVSPGVEFILGFRE